MKKELSDLLRSPWAVKILFLIYCYWIVAGIQIATKDNLPEQLKGFSPLSNIAISLTLLGLIISRVHWTWIVGIADTIKSFGMGLYVLLKKESILATANQLQTESLDALGTFRPDIAKNALEVGITITIIVMFISDLIMILLWLKAKKYFVANRRSVDLAAAK